MVEAGDGSQRPNQATLSRLFSGFWYLSSLKTRFCEIHFPRSAPSKPFGGIQIKKSRQIRPGAQNARYRKKLAKLYFGDEIHIRTDAAGSQKSNEGYHREEY
jgi:hypothetical protein